MSVSYTSLKNDCVSQNEIVSVKDWSVGVFNGRYSSVKIPAKKHAITILGYDLNMKNIFYLNVTYPGQAKKAFGFLQASKSLKEIRFKILKILPYEELYKNTEEVIADELRKNFPNLAVQTTILAKNNHFIITNDGNEQFELKPEAFLKKMVRSLKKDYAVISCQENNLKVF